MNFDRDRREPRRASRWAVSLAVSFAVSCSATASKEVAKPSASPSAATTSPRRATGEPDRPTEPPKAEEAASRSGPEGLLALVAETRSLVTSEHGGECNEWEARYASDSQSLTLERSWVDELAEPNVRVRQQRVLSVRSGGFLSVDYLTTSREIYDAATDEWREPGNRMAQGYLCGENPIRELIEVVPSRHYRAGSLRLFSNRKVCEDWLATRRSGCRD